MDLLTYLRNYEPNELVHFGGNTYCTREHDSLKISNGKWYWFSRGIGGYTALDYLIKVKEMPFMEAVETIMGRSAVLPPVVENTPKKEKPKAVLLPQASRCATHAVNYLIRRGIDYELIDYCISTGRLYESYPHHNVVFVGLDMYNKPRYANLRGIGSDFKGEANGSDKRFSFNIPAENSDTVPCNRSKIYKWNWMPPLPPTKKQGYSMKTAKWNTPNMMCSPVLRNLQNPRVTVWPLFGRV